MRTIRIGSGAGYSGDRIEPALELAEKGDIQYLVFECLGERTVALAQQARMKNPEAGYDPLLEDRMRAVLAASCPEAEVLAGRGEDIPLPAASVDAVVISAAWHWLDPGRAVPEITRVLRPGGRLGVIWISRDMRVPWVAEFNAFARESREADRPADSGRRHREVVFPPGTPVSPPEQRSVEFSVPMTKDHLVGLLGTYSGIITLEADQRAEFSRRVRAFLDRQPWDRVDLPLMCRCLRSTRLADGAIMGG